jgi:3-oxoacyl-[acyl-carrier protein] reductase
MQHQAEVALITGSRRGIGLGIAVCLARAGFNIVMNGTALGELTAESIRQVKTEGVRVAYIQADISLRADRERLISGTKSQFGRLDILVNNAGVNPEVRQDILEATEESFDRVIDINLKGPYFLSQIAAKWMIQQKQDNSKAQPKIINISSISAYTASTQRGEYCLSKAGISMMTKLFAARLAEYGIGVYEIRPGIIDTDMTAPVKDHYSTQIAGGLTPIKRWGYPEDIARAVSGIALGHFPFSTGEVINVDGGFHLKIL